jgi:hypothetical protein
MDVIVPGPAFHRNTVPSATSPWTETSLTSGFQVGQPLRSAMRSHTASGEAAISICPSEKTGAFRSTFTIPTYPPWLESWLTVRTTFPVF